MSFVFYSFFFDCRIFIRNSTEFIFRALTSLSSVYHLPLITTHSPTCLLFITRVPDQFIFRFSILAFHQLYLSYSLFRSLTDLFLLFPFLAYRLPYLSLSVFIYGFIRELLMSSQNSHPPIIPSFHCLQDPSPISRFSTNQNRPSSNEVRRFRRLPMLELALRLLKLSMIHYLS